MADGDFEGALAAVAGLRGRDCLRGAIVGAEGGGVELLSAGASDFDGQVQRSEFRVRGGAFFDALDDGGDSSLAEVKLFGELGLREALGAVGEVDGLVAR